MFIPVEQDYDISPRQQIQGDLKVRRVAGGGFSQSPPFTAAG